MNPSILFLIALLGCENEPWLVENAFENYQSFHTHQHHNQHPKPQHNKPTSNLVARSKNSVALSKNYIKKITQPHHHHHHHHHHNQNRWPFMQEDNVITRATSQILNAPVGTTDVTTLTLETDVHVTSTIEFVGPTAINGNGNIMYLDAGGALQIDTATSVSIKNITIKGVGGQNIFCVDNTGKITFSNVNWIQNKDFTFAKGSLEIASGFHCIGNGYNFIYKSAKNFLFDSGASLILDNNFSFNYVPSSSDPNLISFADNSCTIYLNSSKVCTGTGGLQLSGGSLFISGQSLLSSAQGAAITLGDGTTADDMNCIFDTGAILELSQGSLIYDNVSTSSFVMRDTNAILRINPGTSLTLLENLDLGPGNLYISSSANFSRPNGAQVTGSVSFF